MPGGGCRPRSKPSGLCFGEDELRSDEIGTAERPAFNPAARVSFRFREHVINLVRAHPRECTSQAGVFLLVAKAVQCRGDKAPQFIAIHSPKWKDMTILDVGVAQGLARKISV